jgi:putative MATE family efflux protein
MGLAKKKRDLTEGPIFTQLILFVIPLVLTGILQVAYNMADNIVVGKFSGDENALGAVGSTASVTTLMINLLISIASGAGVVIAQAHGAKDDKAVSRTVHTSMGLSIVMGFGLAALGILLCKPILTLMGTQDVFFDNAVLYMTIVCIGLPASAVYNFGAAILRSIGDSKTSLYILATSGLVNVALNLVFVCVFKMTVDGVALATIISQYISAVWIVIVLVRRRGESYKLYLKKICLELVIIKRVMRIGLPIAFQSVLFSISNIVVTATMNTFPPEVVNAKTIAFNIEGVTYTAMNSFSNAAMTFVGQNWGAKKYSRINKTALYAVIQVAVVGILIAQGEIFFGEELASLYVDKANSNGPAVVAAVQEIFAIMLATYFLCGIMEVMSGVLKALGFSTISMVACLIGLAFRVAWLLFVVPTERFHTIFGLFLSYTLSWILTIILLAICFIYAWRKLGIMRGAKLEKINQETEI